MDIKQEVTNFLKKYVNMNKEDIYSSLELPPDDKFGDISFPCFYLAKESKTDPGNFSKKLREKLVLPEGFIFNRIEVAGPYLNFFLDYKKFIPMLLKEINQTRNYGKGKTKNEKIMLEYISPNPLKDLHIGHLRQAAIGVSLYRILDYYGFSVIPAVYYNDSGTHIAKCLWAYDKWYKGNESEIKNKGAWLGEIYVRANKESKDNKKAQEEIRNIHKSLEEEKNKWTRLKEKLYPLSIEYFNQFYKDIGANFEKEYYDSDFIYAGRKIVENLSKTKYLTYENKTPVLDLTEFGLNKTLLSKSDGTALYLTKDLAMAFQRFADFNLSRSIYMTGSEQKLNFEQLFKTLEILKLKNASKLYHLPVELVYDKNGKKFSSREGNADSYKTIFEKAFEMSLKKVDSSKINFSEKKKKEIAKKIAVGALLYYMNKVSFKKSINLDLETALSFEGNTGPYLQYSYVRALNIIEKAKIKASLRYLSRLDTKQEIDLIKKIYSFYNCLEKSAESYQPHIIAEYAFELASLFSRFYENCSISKVDDSLGSARLYLVQAYLKIIEKCLYLLGIPIVNEM